MPKKRNRKKKKNRSQAQQKQLTIPEQQILPIHIKTKFNNLVKHYEMGHYAKGLKEADRILEDYPKNGETIAMKGLCMLNQKNREEDAKALITEATKYNVKSHICWHCLGLMHRHCLDYNKAAKCLMQSVRMAQNSKEEKDTRILADLSLIHVQERDYERFSELRVKLLTAKPSQKPNWVASSVGAFLCDRMERCISLLQTWWDTSNSKTEPDPDNNELLFLHTRAIMGKGELQEALMFLKDNESFITNKLEMALTEAEILEELGEFDRALDIYKSLVERNPDNSNLYDAVIRLHAMTQTDLGDILEFYDEYTAANPKADVPRRVPLFIATGQDFEVRLESYMKVNLRRSVPSLWTSLRGVCQDSGKQAVVRQKIEQYIEQLRAHRRFSEEDEEGSESPGVLLWAMYFYGNLLDSVNESQLALEVIDDALSICPSNVDIRMLKARVFKHQGNYEEAYRIMDYVRSLDTADRYLNTKCSRFAFRAGCFKRGEWTMRLFLRPSDGLDAVEDLQVVWYTVSKGIGHTYFNQHREALTEFERVYHVYESVWNDQFDFHHYAMRKAYVTTWLKMIKFMDNLRRQPFFVKAAKHAIPTYLLIHDMQRRGEDFDAEVKELPEDIPPTPIEKDKKKRYTPDDFTKDPLGAANRWVKHMTLVLEDDIDTFIFAAAIHRRRGKHLLALRNFQKGLAMDASNPHLLYELALFFHQVETSPDPSIQEFLNPETFDVSPLLAALDASSLIEFVDNISDRFPDSLMHQFKAFQAQLFLGLDTSSSEPKLSQLPGTLEECKHIHDWLQRMGQYSPEIHENFMRLFPLATYFR